MRTGIYASDRMEVASMGGSGTWNAGARARLNECPRTLESIRRVSEVGRRDGYFCGNGMCG